MEKIPRTIAGVAAAAALAATAAGAAALPERLTARVDEVAAELVEVRRDLHRHPELSGEEERTARVVAERLRALGLAVTTGVGGHGVVAVLEGGRPGGVVGFRADMDASFSMAPDPVAEIASKTPWVRHICGHDVHTAVGLGVAEALVAVRDELPGTVKLLFQPAEENAQGARAMVADGALDDPRPEAIFAVHAVPLPAGQIGTVEGPTLAGRDAVAVRLGGDGDRGAASAAVAEALRAAGTIDPPETMAELAAMPLPAEEFAFVQVQAETDDEVSGMVMTSGPAASARVQAFLERRLDEIAGEIEGVTAELDYRPRVIAGAYSDPELVRRARPAIRAALGEAGEVASTGASPMFSEDFGSLLGDDIPGAMFWLGVSNAERGIVGMPHSPEFAVDEAAIAAGAKAMAAVLWSFLSEAGRAAG